MSAALPEALQSYGGEHVVYQRRPTLAELMTPRRQHIPTFYRAHPDPEAIVLDENGEPLLAEFDKKPIRVGELPIERRWAVGEYDRRTRTWKPGHHVLQYEDYKHLHQLWIMELYDLVREKTGIESIKFEGRIEVEAVPSLRAFLNDQVDPEDESRTIAMHYRNVTKGAKPEVLYDASGESSRPRDDVLLETYRTAPEKLTASEMAEVESRLVARDDPMRELTALSGKLVRGEITPEAFAAESQRIASASPAPEVGKSQTGRVAAVCGKKLWPSQMDEHRESCVECQKE